MKTRIYRTFVGLTLPALLLLTTALCLYYYNAFKAREMAAVRDSANLIAYFLNHGASPGDLTDYLTGGALRVTVISPDGRVILDSVSDASARENHRNREEVAEALESGTGEAARYSDTLSVQNYYCAVRLRNGDVLRVSKTMDSISRVFTSSLPAVAAVAVLFLLAANALAHKVTGHILAPLGRIDLESDNRAMYEELLPYVRKIDSQKREIAAQIAALRSRTEMTEAIIENMREGLLLLDESGVAVTANHSAQKIFGLTEPSGQNILHICRDLDFQQGVKRCLAGENLDLSFTRGDKIYGVYCSPVPGEAGGAVVFLLDVTEKQEAERQRREFSANVSHELKTPLAAISALAEMIESGMAREEDVAVFAARISEQTRRLIGIIEDIIRLSEFDEEAVSAEMQPFDLYELASSVIGALERKGGDKGVAVRLAGEHVTVSANRRMIDELLYNLIDNAIKYNKENGSVTVLLSKEGGGVSIAVSDTGIGIPEEHHSHVFERFYRVDKSRSKKTGGTGLGLSIVKHIAAHHGGGVELASSPGAGTTVTVRIADQGEYRY